MKKFFLLILIFAFIFFNIYFFFLSIKLGDEIALCEKKIEKIHHENINLEKELSSFDSLEYAEKLASKMDFTKKAEVYFLENLKYALAVER